MGLHSDQNLWTTSHLGLFNAQTNTTSSKLCIKYYLSATRDIFYRSFGTNYVLLGESRETKIQRHIFIRLLGRRFQERICISFRGFIEAYEAIFSTRLSLFACGKSDRAYIYSLLGVLAAGNEKRMRTECATDTQCMRRSFCQTGVFCCYDVLRI